jgi:hypothetical protein
LIFFSILFFNIRLLGLKFHNFFYFLLCEVIPTSYNGTHVSRIDSFFYVFFTLIFFFSFAFYYLVFFRVNLCCFIQSLQCKVIMVSRLSCEFGMLTRVKFFCSFLKLIFFFKFSFNICFPSYWASNFFYFFSLWGYPIIIEFFSLSSNKIVNTFKNI